MIIQANNPWDLFNTIFPISVYILILIYDFLMNGIPKFNYNTMRRGLGILILAISMFIKGLDEHSDYMRIAHSLWHISIGIATFYLWQIQEKRFISFREVFDESYHKFIRPSIIW